MNKQEEKNFLDYCKSKNYPRQTILFEYFLKNIFDAIEKRDETQRAKQPLHLPYTALFHLFMYAGLINHFEIKKGARSILTYFPEWFLEIKMDLGCYVHWLPRVDFKYSPFLSFVHTNNGFSRRTTYFSPDEDLAVRICFGLPVNCRWNKDELTELILSQDEIAEIKNDFDASLEILLQKTKNWPIKSLKNVKAFSTVGFLNFLALPPDLFKQILDGSTSPSIDLSCYDDIFLVMEKALQSRIKEQYSFIDLPCQPLMLQSPEHDYFISGIMDEIMLSAPQNASLVCNKMHKNRYVYLKKLEQ